LAFYFHILTTMHGQNHIKFEGAFIKKKKKMMMMKFILRWCCYVKTS